MLWGRGGRWGLQSGSWKVEGREAHLYPGRKGRRAVGMRSVRNQA